jgi:hypothetical protein
LSYKKYNAQKKGKKFVTTFFSSSCILIFSSSHLYFLPPVLALATLSKDSLIGVLLTNTVKWLFKYGAGNKGCIPSIVFTCCGLAGGKNETVWRFGEGGRVWDRT